MEAITMKKSRIAFQTNEENEDERYSNQKGTVQKYYTASVDPIGFFEKNQKRESMQKEVR